MELVVPVRALPHRPGPPAIASPAGHFYTVTAYCNRCQHSRDLDLEAMAAQLGAEARVQGSADSKPVRIGGRPLRCSVDTCRSYNTSIRISPTVPGGPMAK